MPAPHNITTSVFKFADKGALAAALVGIGTLAWQLRGQLAELDINPLRVLPRGHGVLALDAVVVPRAAGP